MTRSLLCSAVPAGHSFGQQLHPEALRRGRHQQPHRQGVYDHGREDERNTREGKHPQQRQQQQQQPQQQERQSATAGFKQQRLAEVDEGAVAGSGEQ